MLTKAKVGRRVHLDVDVIGEPEPEIKWYDEDGREITTDGEHFTVESANYNTKFTIEHGKRKHSQKYKIVAKNEHGKDQEWVEIVFLGPPSKPMGPLTVHDITSSSCKLKWKPPEDDGGLPIKQYVVEKMDKATGRYILKILHNMDLGKHYICANLLGGSLLLIPSRM